MIPSCPSRFPLLASTLAIGLSFTLTPISGSATPYHTTVRLAPDAASAPLTIDSFSTAQWRSAATAPAGSAATAPRVAKAPSTRPLIPHLANFAPRPAPAHRRAIPTRRHAEHTLGDGYTALAHLAKAGFKGTLRIASTMLHMVATAYTAHCLGCSGRTALGYRAGHGIVAVDPRIIPLGTRLYIPGYGLAIAGDTGGDIKGARIDLGFNGTAEALRFGRRPVSVYVLSSLASP